MSSHVWSSCCLSERLSPQPDRTGAARSCAGSGTELLLVCFHRVTVVTALSSAASSSSSSSFIFSSPSPMVSVTLLLPGPLVRMLPSTEPMQDASRTPLPQRAPISNDVLKLLARFKLILRRARLALCFLIQSRSGLTCMRKAAVQWIAALILLLYQGNCNLLK